MNQLVELTSVQAKLVRPPLIKECLANIECKVIDIVEKHTIVVLEAVAAYINTASKEKRRFMRLVMERSSSTDARLTGRR